MKTERWEIETDYSGESSAGNDEFKETIISRKLETEIESKQTPSVCRLTCPLRGPSAIGSAAPQMNNAAPQLDRENRKAHQNQFPARAKSSSLINHFSSTIAHPIKSIFIHVTNNTNKKWQDWVLFPLNLAPEVFERMHTHTEERNIEHCCLWDYRLLETVGWFKEHQREHI